jgi:hypothetical protein
LASPVPGVDSLRAQALNPLITSIHVVWPDEIEAVWIVGVEPRTEHKINYHNPNTKYGQIAKEYPRMR